MSQNEQQKHTGELALLHASPKRSLLIWAFYTAWHCSLQMQPDDAVAMFVSGGRGKVGMRHSQPHSSTMRLRAWTSCLMFFCTELSEATAPTLPLIDSMCPSVLVRDLTESRSATMFSFVRTSFSRA